MTRADLTASSLQPGDQRSSRVLAIHIAGASLFFWLVLGAVVTFALALSFLNMSQADVDAEVGK